jgi:uncharacterized protein YcgI (DUF1989 family)
MPLLLKHQAAEPLPAEAHITVAHGTAGIIRAHRGQFLRITDVAGGQPAGLVGFVADNLAEFLSPHHTRVFSNSYVLTLGMRMVTNLRRPMMVLGRDTTRRHDLLLPGSDRRSLDAAGLPEEQGCTEAMRAALAEAALQPPKLPDPINLFLDVTVALDGRLTVGAAPSRAGDTIICRVLIDTIFVVAGCASGVAPGERAGPLRVDVVNEL